MTPKAKGQRSEGWADEGYLGHKKKKSYPYTISAFVMIESKVILIFHAVHYSIFSYTRQKGNMIFSIENISIFYGNGTNARFPCRKEIEIHWCMNLITELQITKSMAEKIKKRKKKFG